MNIKNEVEKLLKKAVEQRTNDIFFLPKQDGYHLLLRNYLGLKLEQKLAFAQAQEIINYFKYAAQIDISEHRRPQVGAMEYITEKDKYYLRLSSLGDFKDHESLVIRIIYQIDQSRYFFNSQLNELTLLAKKRGLIITSGPTGSGKTTTMYEIAKKLAVNKVVMTIEDPVEVEEVSFLQTQVNLEAEISYQNLLKAALRHRPDILIVGEIRDYGTARLAIDAALSGHLVLATVHAKSTLQTIDRLQGLKIDEEELKNCLTAVSYQRLLLDQDQKLSCLFDIADYKVLQAYLKNKNLSNGFINWQNQLIALRKEGRISDDSYQKFYEG